MMASLPPSTDSQATDGSRKTNAAAAAALRPPEQGVNCPRCDSPNTKFCYYNNYSLTQPRHFCKTCRRYWTKGGALRNVPVGGGCRKNKKSKSSVSSSTSSSHSSRALDPFDAYTIPDVVTGGGGLKLYPGFSRPPAMDFQLGVLPFTRLQPPAVGGGGGQFVAFSDFSSSAGAAAMQPGGYGDQMGAVNCSTSGHGNLALSIESLSSINQDLHWKLQQQRLAMMFGGGANRESAVSEAPYAQQQQQQQQEQEEEEPVAFQMMTDNTRAEVCGGAGGINKVCGGGGDTTTAWFFEGSYTMPTNNSSSSNNNMISSTSGNNTSNWNGVSGWNDLQHDQFTALP